MRLFDIVTMILNSDSQYRKRIDQNSLADGDEIFRMIGRARPAFSRLLVEELLQASLTAVHGMFLATVWRLLTFISGMEKCTTASSGAIRVYGFSIISIVSASDHCKLYVSKGLHQK